MAPAAEREACAARLREAAVEGRLDVTELDERLGAAYRARSQLDLAKLTADLPEAPAALAQTRGSRWPIAVCRGLLALGAANTTLLGLWMADVGTMRHVVILGITEFNLPWPAIPRRLGCDRGGGPARSAHRADNARRAGPDRLTNYAIARRWLYAFT